MDLCTHNENPLVHTDPDKGVSYSEAVNEPTALVSDIQTADFGKAHFPLQIAAIPRHVVVRAQGGKDDEIQILGLHPGILQGLAGSFEAEIRTVNPLLRKTSFDDPAALLDPFVTGLKHLCQVKIGNAPFGEIPAHSEDSRSYHDKMPSLFTLYTQ